MEMGIAERDAVAPGREARAWSMVRERMQHQRRRMTGLSGGRSGRAIRMCGGWPRLAGVPVPWSTAS